VLSRINALPNGGVLCFQDAGRGGGGSDALDRSSSSHSSALDSQYYGKPRTSEVTGKDDCFARRDCVAYCSPAIGHA
jgi:hypothetical protein